MPKPTLADYLARIPVTVEPDHTLAFVRTLMLEHKIRHVPVVSADRVVGVISERDIFVLEANMGGADDVEADRFMRKDPYVVDITSDLATTAREMAARRIGSAVLVNGGKLAGMFTATDALRALADALS